MEGRPIATGQGNQEWGLSACWAITLGPYVMDTLFLMDALDVYLPSDSAQWRAETKAFGWRPIIPFVRQGYTTILQ
jgi:hypothetical protein